MEGKPRLPAFFFPAFSRLLRHGDLVNDDYVDNILSILGLELHSRAIVGSAKGSWVLDIRHYLYLRSGFLPHLDSELRLVNAFQTSLNDYLESGRRMHLYSLGHSCMQSFSPRRIYSEEPSEPSIPSYAVVVSALVLLSFIYQYLTGYVDRGGSKAYSRSSLDFRDIYVAIVLFLGAYVWIKFREVAFKGVYSRKLRDKQGSTKVVYEARLKPPKCNGEQVRRLDLGQFATPQEARNKFRIAAFYYGRDAGLLDGWFQVPPMSEEERSLTGKEKRRWVLGQAKKVYEDFEKKKAEAREDEEAALLLQELLEVWDDQVTPEQDEVNVNPCGTSLLNPAEPQQLVCVDQAEISGMGMAMIGDNHGLECSSHSFDGMHEGLALPNGHSLGSQEGCALPVSQLPPNTENGMSLNGSDQMDLLQSLVRSLQQQNSLQQQQISHQQHQISVQQRQIQDLVVQMLQFRNQQGKQQQQLPEPSIQNPQWSYRLYHQEQQLQDVNQGVSVLEMEMEQSMHR